MLTPEQADAGLIELVVAKGENVLVDLGDARLRNPDLEAEVARVLLDIPDEGDACRAVRTFAETAGLPVQFYLGQDAIVIRLG